MFGTSVCEPTFSIVNCIRSKYKSSTSDGNLISELNYSESVKYALDFEKKRVENISLTF